MKLKPFAWPILLTALLSCGACAISAPARRERAAERAAVAWLQIVDQGRYSESWNDTSEFFRNAVSRAKWIKIMGSFRTPLGTHFSRVLKSARFASSMPGAPEGEYMVLQFTSSFKNKKVATETVTPMRDKDGVWRVTGYYVK